MVGWPLQLNRREFEQTLGDSEGQGSLVCCSPWGRSELDVTEQLNNFPNSCFFSSFTHSDLNGINFLLSTNFTIYHKL